jgi:hypothetical protein
MTAPMLPVTALRVARTLFSPGEVHPVASSLAGRADSPVAHVHVGEPSVTSRPVCGIRTRLLSVLDELPTGRRLCGSCARRLYAHEERAHRACRGRDDFRALYADLTLDELKARRDLTADRRALLHEYADRRPNPTPAALAEAAMEVACSPMNRTSLSYMPGWRPWEKPHRVAS